MNQLLYILLQVAPESWLVNLPSTIGVASILGFFVYYFISQIKQKDEKHEAAIKLLTDRYEAAIDKLRIEQNAERQMYRDRIDSLIDKLSEITRQAIASMNANTGGINELKDAINELRGRK